MTMVVMKVTMTMIMITDTLIVMVVKMTVKDVAIVTMLVVATMVF